MNLKEWLSSALSTKKEFLINYGKIKNTEEFFLSVLDELKNSVSEGNIANIKQLINILEYINECESEYAVKKYCDNENNPIIGTNLVILACKYNSVEALELFLQNHTILEKLCTTRHENNFILPDDHDEMQHNAFYYALRSGNIKIAENLVFKWPGNYFTTNSEQLDHILSSAFEELKLKNVPMTSEFEDFIEKILLNLRFCPDKPTKIQVGTDELGTINERLKLLGDTIKSLSEEYFPSSVDVDKKFLYKTSFIAKNIHMLKEQLKSTYGELPWEEMEFCLIAFISSCLKTKEINITVRMILHKVKILNYLEIFRDNLYKIDVLKCLDATKLFEMPEIGKAFAMKEIVKNESRFTDLYSDFYYIRDTLSLKNIIYYTRVAIEARAKSNEGKLIITRALQVIGENVKNTSESPNLSSSTRNLLLLSLPLNTRNILTNLRNSLSCDKALPKKSDAGKNLGDEIYIDVQNDLKNLCNIIMGIFFNKKIQMVKILLKRIIEADDFEKMKEASFVLSAIELEEMNVHCIDMMAHKQLQKLVTELSDCLTDKTLGEMLYLKKIRSMVSMESTKLIDFEKKCMIGIDLLTDFNHRMKYYNIEKDALSDMKIRATQILENITLEVEPSRFKQITHYAQFIYRSVSLRSQSEADKIARLVFETSELSEIGLSCIDSTEELDQILKVPFEQKKAEETGNEKGKVKIYRLEAMMQNNELNSSSNERVSFYTREKSLQFVIEMLVLDVFLVLGGRLENDDLFLDGKIPTLCSKTLGNHFEQNNVVSDLLSSETLLSSLLNVEKLVSENVIDDELRIEELKESNIFQVKHRFEQNLHILALQKSMFTAIEEQDFDGLKLALKKGADVYGENIQSCNALHYASKVNNLGIVKFLLEENVNVNKRNSKGQSPLHFAAAYGQKQIVELLVRDIKMDTKTADLSGKTPLHLAVIFGNIDVIKTLLRYKCDSNIPDRTGFLDISAAHYATRIGNVDAAKCILENYKNIDSDRSEGGLSFLYEAAERGSTDLVTFLLQKGANVHDKTDEDSTPLHVASLNGHLDTVNILISMEANVNSRTFENCTPLHYAVKSDHLKVVMILLKHGADVNCIDATKQYTPLHYAAEGGYESIVNILLKYKANVSAKTASGTIPLHLTSLKGHLQIAASLIQCDTDINSRDRSNNTSLHFAAESGNKALVELLITKNGLVSTKNSKHGFTPLHIALSYSKKDVAELLIINKADVNSETHTGTTPLHLAAKGNDKIIIDLLIKHKSKINAVDNDGRIPLHVAVEEGHAEVASVLVKNGANVNCKNSMSLTPLHLAVLYNHKEIISILLDNEAVVDDLQAKEFNFIPLQVAIISGEEKTVEMLIQKGSNVNVSVNGETVLMSAVRFNNIKIINILLKMGADIFNPVCNAVFLAVFEGYLDIVELFLKHKNRLKKNISSSTKSSIVKEKTFLANDFAKKKLKTINESCEYSLTGKYNTENNCLLDGEISLLRAAVMTGHKEITKKLIEDGEPVNSLFSSKTTPIAIAAYKGYVDIVNILIEHKADIHIPDDEKQTPLHVAAVFGHNNVVEVLIKNGANVNAKDFKNRAPLELAVKRSHLKVVKTFFEMGKDVNKSCHFENGTLLHIAAQEKNLEVIKFLVDIGCDIHAKNKHGSKPIHIASRDNLQEAVEFFIIKGSSVNERGMNNQTPLHYAVLNVDLNVINYLISLGADVNAKDNSGATPLHVAALYSKKETVLCLLSNGAFYNHFYTTEDEDVNNLFKYNDRLLDGVIYNNTLEVEKSFEQGAFGNIRNDRWGTPLHYASWKGYSEIVNILLEHKCDPNIHGPKGYTPLHYASQYSHISIVKALLSKNAIYNAYTESGETPLEVAMDENIIKLLEVIDKSFEGVQNQNVHVVKNITEIKNEDSVKAILNACNKDNKSLIVVAILYNFPYVQDLKDILPEGANFTMKEAISFLSAGEYINALRIFIPIYEKKREMLGLNNPATLDIQEYVAKIWYKREKYSRALNILEDIYVKQRDNLGRHHKETLRIGSSIALHLHKLKKYGQAFGIFQAVYSIQKGMLGSNHEDTLQTQLHMALALNKLGKFKEALVHNQEVYEKRTAANHPDAIYTLNNIATVSANLNQYNEAIKILKKVLVKQKQYIGNNHPDVLKTMNKIAGILFKQGKYSEALNVYKELLRNQDKILGPNHIDTLDTQYIMANICFSLGQMNDSYKLYSECSNKRQDVLGHNHPTVLDIAKKIAFLSMNLKITDHAENFITYYL